ncbi:hypothetical protein SAMN05444287_1963 [Octadecabacter temperatus]|uniref:Uncharacterized protein n=1 Tax=Octadecabacter temperatus TaxID=1458307 RepID=A0A0K0Y793_9RHOB|nr:hypothetical protein [Octadecabacter temperatus]AKS46839.1 hypothetical protein OSB_23030 [Octadecabacter temperatus]SIO22265.1 hypothetical protein SAMN05444287_1963 [Octadecabacter temperatus]
MPRIALALAATVSLSLAACMEPTSQGEPLTGDALEARLSGQVMTIRPLDPVLGTPTRAELSPDGTVVLSYANGEVANLRWKVETQGLCFPLRSDPNEFSCRNIVITSGNRFSIYDTRFGGGKIATGTLTPL